MLRLPLFASVLILGLNIGVADAQQAFRSSTIRCASGGRPLKMGTPKKTSRSPTVELFQINTKETLYLRFHDDRGRAIQGWQKRFDRFMRCHKTNKTHRMNSRLARLLYQTSRHFGGRKLEVISGYRHPKVARNPKSPHKRGLACDFRVVGVTNIALRDYLQSSFDHVGVGYYPNSIFIHLDVRKGSSAFWVDYSGPGESAKYSEDPKEAGTRGLPIPDGSSQQLERDESIDDLLDAAKKNLQDLKRPSRPKTR